MGTYLGGLQLFVLFIINVFMALAGQLPTKPEQQVTWTKAAVDPNYVKVTRVIDGDTIVIEGNAHVRYINIDTPELGNKKSPAECYAEAAKIRNKDLVEGKMVRLEKDVSETDRYGRLLRYVFLDDMLVNEELLREGYAKAVTFPPDVKYADYFSGLEKTAAKEKVGLWTKCAD